MCTHNSTVQPRRKAEIEERQGKFSAQVALAHAFILTPSILVSEAWAQDVKEATEKDNQLRAHKWSEKQPGRTTFSTNMLYQIVERTEYIYDRWKERNDQQIQREERSAIKPKKRRQIMRQPQTTERSRDARTAAVPPTAKQWGDDLLDFKTVAMATVALELRVVAYACRLPPPPRVA
ncbi:hypothetical protein H4S07_001759 [Coemansia furcata]|uniref:Uncharacterized protein n=1 Tax=Coemansia furcata TaxID=417177 RepID=A0ACC1LND4_9FUNG|nr:hypothetical protein H4S07_001759 [Coemansia furcata]